LILRSSSGSWTPAEAALSAIFAKALATSLAVLAYRIAKERALAKSLLPS
jgi:hypothetical protein